jgi:hypothetical protein
VVFQVVELDCRLRGQRCVRVALERCEGIESSTAP